MAAAAGTELTATEAGLEAELGDGKIVILTPAGFRARFGLEPPDARRGLLFAGIEIAVADLDRALGYAGPTAKRHGDAIVTPPAPGLGAVLAFTEGAGV